MSPRQCTCHTSTFPLQINLIQAFHNYKSSHNKTVHKNKKQQHSGWLTVSCDQPWVCLCTRWCLWIYNPHSLTMHLIQHTEPAGLCIHTSITASVKTLILHCHRTPKAMPPVPDEDEVNRKSICLWHWHVAAAGTGSRDGVSESLTTPFWAPTGSLSSGEGHRKMEPSVRTLLDTSLCAFTLTVSCVKWEERVKIMKL